MDRQLPGVLGIAVVLATVVSLLMIPGRDAILVTSIDYPKEIQRSNDRHAFAVSLVATRPVEDIDIWMRTIYWFDPEDPDLIGASREEVETKFAPLIVLIEAVSNLGIDPEPRLTMVRSGEDRYDLVYYDFLPIFTILSRRHENPNFPLATSAYGFLYDDEGLRFSFKGGAEIFPQERSTLSEIIVEVNGIPREQWAKGDKPVYQMGHVPIEDVSKGDRIDLIYYIDGRRVGGWRLLNLVDIWAGGEEIHTSVRLINA